LIGVFISVSRDEARALAAIGWDAESFRDIFQAARARLILGQPRWDAIMKEYDAHREPYIIVVGHEPEGPAPASSGSGSGR
jgi:hypothetical protein